MKIECVSCNREFEATKKQERFIDQCIAKNMEMLMLDCPLCGLAFPYALRCSSQQGVEKHYVCPVCKDNNCLVVHIKEEDEDFWGCGECGTVWFCEEDIGKK